MSDMDNEELEATRIKTVKQAYDTVYTEMCKYMELYNQAVDDIQENYYSKDKILKALGIEYRDQDLSEDRICCIIEATLKEKRRVEKENEKLKSDNYNLDRENAKLFDRTIDLERIINKTKGSKVTEQELKDMILGMLE